MVPVYDQSLLLLVDAVCTYVCVYVCDLTCKFVHMIFMIFHETFYEDLKVVLKKIMNLANNVPSKDLLIGIEKSFITLMQVLKSAKVFLF